MKKLVIFYSFEGSTKLLAESIAQTIGADIIELKPESKTLKSHGFLKYFWGGRQVIFKERPQLEKFDKNPNDYDLIFIGTPVWAWSYSPATRSFLESQNLKNKKIALFCANEGNKGKVFENMKTKLANNEIIGQMDFLNVAVNKEKHIEAVKKWANDLAVILEK